MNGGYISFVRKVSGFRDILSIRSEFERVEKVKKSLPTASIRRRRLGVFDRFKTSLLEPLLVSTA